MADTWRNPKSRGLSTLEQRAVRVVAPRGVRHPKDLSPEAQALADRALQRIVDVMEEEVHSKRAKGVLSAAVEIREELCGPKTQKIAIEGSLEQILTASFADRGNANLMPPIAPTPELAAGALANELSTADREPEPCVADVPE